MNLCPSGCQQVLSRIPFDWGESTREGGWSMAREIWSTDFVTDSRTGTDGPLWWGESAQEGCQRTASRHGLADGNGCPLWEGESTRGEEVWKTNSHLDGSINSGIMSTWQRLKTSSLKCDAIPKGFVFQTFAKYAIPSSVRLGKKAVATESTKRPCRATRASISRMIKEWQKHIR